MTDTTAPIAVRYEFADGAARITLVEGDRGNPVHPAQVDQLLDAVLRAQREQAKVIVLAAEGRFFSVGGDLESFGATDDPGRFIDDLAFDLHRVVAELMQCDAVVVSVVQGTAAGAGFPLACAADVILAADSAKFSLAYTKVGLSPDGGSSMLVHSLGLHRTLRLALLGDLLTAQEAYDAGLVARVVPAADLAATTDQVVATLVAGSAGAFAAAKRVIRTQAVPAPEAALRREQVAIASVAPTPDGREGVQAFLEKRPAAFN